MNTMFSRSSLCQASGSGTDHDTLLTNLRAYETTSAALRIRSKQPLCPLVGGLGMHCTLVISTASSDKSAAIPDMLAEHTWEAVKCRDMGWNG